MIKKKDGKYCVYSEDGKRLFGCYATFRKAKDRLREIEFFKKQNKK